MYYQTIHEKPMAFGYVSRVPASTDAKDQTLSALVDAGQYKDLCRRYGIRYLLAKPDRDVLGVDPSIRLLYDKEDLRVYDLGADVPCQVAPEVVTPKKGINTCFLTSPSNNSSTTARRAPSRPTSMISGQRRWPKRARPLDARFEPVTVGLKLVETFDVTFAGFGGQPIKGWLLLPRERSEPLPCVVEFIGYGGGRGHPLDWLSFSVAGYAHLIMDTRGQGSTWRKGDTTDTEIDPVTHNFPAS